VIGTGITSGQQPRDSGVAMSYDYSHGTESTPRIMDINQERMAEEQQEARSAERKTSTGGGMKSTMRESPEYEEQKAAGPQQANVEAVSEEQA
jgi:hypothetical protein